MRRKMSHGRRATSLIVAATVVSGWSAPSAVGANSLTLVPTNEHQARVVSKAWGKPGRVWAYWGSLTEAAGAPWGSYRATCTWIGPKGTAATKFDNRLTCTVVLAARAVPGSTLIAEGLVRMPKESKNTGLFNRAHECSSVSAPPPNCKARQLAITGATGSYKAWTGYVADVRATLSGGVEIAIGPG